MSDNNPTPKNDFKKSVIGRSPLPTIEQTFLIFDKQASSQNDEQELLEEKFISQKYLHDKNNLEIRLAQSWREYQKLKDEFDEVVNSTTWRMTTPVRTFVSTVRRISNSQQWVKTITGRIRVMLSSLSFPKTAQWFQRQQVRNHIFAFTDTFFKKTGKHRNMMSIRQLAAKRHERFSCHINQTLAPEEQPPIDIGVVTYNDKKWLPIFFDSLLAQQFPLEKIALIIVDHSSWDGTLDVWKKLRDKHSYKFRDVKILKQSNRGFGSGQNLAFSHSTAPYFIVSNVDLEFESDALLEIVSAAIIEGNSLGSIEFRQKPYEHPKYYDPITFETAWSAHSCVLFRRDALKAVGGYEKRIFMYGEDTELSYRLRDNGYSVKYCPKAVVWHYYYHDQNPEEAKPLQFRGNTIANSLIRIRFGAWPDILQILNMYFKLIQVRFRSLKQLREVLACFWTVILNSPYFLSTRKQSDIIFPFHNWDFEIRREGAFYKQLRLTKKHLPLVTIIFRTSNGRELWLREALLTAANQTYTNIEVVIIEDGGTSIAPQAEQLFSDYPFSLSYHSLPPNSRSSRGNRGLSVAQGEYLMFLDDNVLLFADHVEILLNGLLNDPQRKAAYSLSMEIKYLPGKDAYCPYHEIAYLPAEQSKQAFDRSKLLNCNYIPIQSIILHRSLYLQYGGFDESLKESEDWDLLLRYSCRNDFLFIEKTTSMYRTPYEPDKNICTRLDTNIEAIRRKHEKRS
jgi:GT2 family glycosyltransferase